MKLTKSFLSVVSAAVMPACISANAFAGTNADVNASSDIDVEEACL